jgi:hypothetical protein
VDSRDGRRYEKVDHSIKLHKQLDKMTIELKDNEDRIACMRNEHAKEIEGLIRDLRGQSVQREKALKEYLEAVRRERRQRLTEMLIEQGRRVDKNGGEQFRGASDADTRRNTEPKQRSTQALETREKRLKVAEKVCSR